MGKAPPGGAGGAFSGAGGASGGASGGVSSGPGGFALGGVNASLTARWVAVRVEGVAPKPRAFHVAIALDVLHSGGGSDGGGGSSDGGGGSSDGGGGGNIGGGGNSGGGGARVLLLGGCAPILGTARTSAAATQRWVGGAGP